MTTSTVPATRRSAPTTALGTRLVRATTGVGPGSFVLWPALALVALALAFGVQDNYWLQVVINAEIMIIAAVGLYVTFGLSGQVSLGQAGFYAIGGYTTGLLVTKAGVPFLPALAAGTALAMLVGIGLGVPALRLRGHYLALVTLGFGQVVALILINWDWLTGGANGVRNIVAPVIGALELRTIPEWAAAIGLIAVAATYVVHRIHHSSFGRVMRSVRDSEVAAAAMGVSLSRVKVLAFSIGAGFAGLAGALNAGFITYISPSTYTLALSVTMLSMVVVGGAHSPWGAVVGAVVLTFLPEVLRDFQEYYLLFYGALVLVMVAFVPQGLWGVVRQLGSLVRGRKPQNLSAPTLDKDGDR